MDRGDDFYLAEALSHQHYEMSHLPGAINLPYEFVDEAEKVLPDKRAEIVVYCMNEECEASREEARELEEKGYVNVLHYAGGKQRWIKAGRPTGADATERKGANPRAGARVASNGEEPWRERHTARRG